MDDVETTAKLYAALKQLLHEVVEAGFETATDYNWPKAIADAKEAMRDDKGASQTTDKITCRVIQHLRYVPCGFEWSSPDRLHSCCLHKDHGEPSCSCWCGESWLRPGGSVVQVPG